MSGERRTVLVTGAASGIGRATALRLAAAGDHVAAWDVDGDGLAETLRMIGEAGGSAETTTLDVSALEASAAAVRDLAARRPIVGLVHAAGIDHQAPFLEETPAGYDRVMGINLRASFFLVQAVGAVMGPGGSIVLLSSVVARSGEGVWAAYAMTKSGVLALTYSAASALGPGVRVNALCPGLIETPMMGRVIDRKRRELGLSADAPLGPAQVFESELRASALKRIGSADDVARVAQFLLSEEAGYITGQAINVDAGMFHS